MGVHVPYSPSPARIKNPNSQWDSGQRTLAVGQLLGQQSPLSSRLLSLCSQGNCVYQNQRLPFGVGDYRKWLLFITPSLTEKSSTPHLPSLTVHSLGSTSGRRWLAVRPHLLPRDFKSGFICSRTLETNSFVSSPCDFLPSHLPGVSQTTEACPAGQAFLTIRDIVCLLRNSPLQMELHRKLITAIVSLLPGLTGRRGRQGS